jgi:putative membrane protein
MTWWCFAQNGPWTWQWQPYPGVWVFVVGLLAGYFGLLRSWKPAQGGPRLPARRVAAFLGGVAVLWIAADWPVGPLGAGYLLSIHTARYLILALIAPPLLLYGIPYWLLRHLLLGRRLEPAFRFLTRPLVAFVIFNGVMVGTHFPAVVGGLKPYQLGSFLLDMTWLASGLVFWWPVLGRLPEWRPLGYPGRILYLILSVFLPTVPASFLTFSDYPLYALYELAPRVSTLSALADQQLAGIVMKTGGGFVIFGTATVLFFRWWAREGGDEA